MKSEHATLIEFNTFLKSPTDKYSFDYKNPFYPYAYVKEILEYFSFWCMSSYFIECYTSVHSERDFTMSKDTDLPTLLADVTFMVRRERFTAGFVATQLDILSKTLDLIIDKEKENEKNL